MTEMQYTRFSVRRNLQANGDRCWRTSQCSLSILVLRFSVLIAVAVLIPSAAYPQAKDTAMRTDSIAPYAHRITLYDEQGEVIDPEDDFAPVYSPKGTCGKCHAYDQISSGWHFNGSDPNRPAGRRAQAWIYTDWRTGTQIPIAERDWKGAHKPGDIGLTAWDFTLMFGRHHTGGGITETSVNADGEPKARWAISGGLEIDCMICHNADGNYDHNERVGQLERQNFRWAPLATSGFAAVRGSAKTLRDDYDPMFGAMSPDQTGPRMFFDRARFDPDDRVFFSMAKSPTSDRCLFCHTNRNVGEGVAEPWQHERDVHLAAGMSCSDCHGHGLDHALVRGYEGEAEDTGQPFRATLSCRGCHLGVQSAAGDYEDAGGRFRAPYPKHYGLPTLHLTRLSCTACHSGPQPAEKALRLQTARAHGLGLSVKQRGDNIPPFIAEPVFVREENGVFEPHRMIWPSFWGTLEEHGDCKPVPLAELERVAGKAFAKKTASSDEWTPLSEDTVKEALRLLGTANKSEAKSVYVCGGLLYSLDDDGTLVAQEHAAAEQYSWALAHEVRPAAKSLGAKGCTECHASGAPIFYSRVDIETPAALGETRSKTMLEIQGLNATLLWLWNFSFVFRPFLKIVGFAASVFIGAVLLLYGLAVLQGLLKFFAREE